MKALHSPWQRLLTPVLALFLTGIAVSPWLFAADLTGEGPAYQSVWAQVYPKARAGANAGPIFKDFYAAAGTAKLTAATQAWQKFHDTYKPKDGSFEDANHERLWTWGKMELERCKYLGAGQLGAALSLEKSLRARAKDIDAGN